MDNVRIRHYRGLMDGKDIPQTPLTYFPPYSPFLNPIEIIFSVWENNVIRGCARNEAELRRLIVDKFNDISNENCGAFYRKMLGYLQRAEMGQVIND